MSGPAVIGKFEGKCADSNIENANGMYLETWRAVPGYEGYYEVSNMGDVRSIDRHIVDKRGLNYCIKGKLLSKCNTSQGYLVVVLSKNGKSKTISIHRLVATAFLPNPKNLYAVNHKDGNKKNNCITNLEWCTLEYNNIHAMMNGLAPATHIVAINQVSGFISEFLSAKQFEIITNSRNASYCLQHDKVCNRYRLFYADDQMNLKRSKQLNKIQSIGGNSPIPIRCIESGETFPSITKCGKFFHIDDELIRHAVRHGTGYVKKLNLTFEEIDRGD